MTIVIDNSIKIIIRIFAVLIKSNNVLMSNFLFKNARKNLMNIVNDFRKHYQFLLKISTKAFNKNFRSKSAISANDRSRIVTSIDIDMKSDFTQRITIRSERIRIYRNNQKKFNVYTALHYDLIRNKYKLSSNCNVLIEENKHRYHFYLLGLFYCVVF